MVRALAATVVATLVLTAPAAAQDETRGYMDVQGLSAPETLEPTLGGLRSAICEAPRARGAAGRAVSRKRALGSARRALGAGKFRRALKRLRTRRVATSATVVGVGKGQAGAALASALAAVELEPRNALALNNAGLILAQTGHPQEAIALLDAALARRANDPPMGLAIRAIAESNKAYALVALRRFREAETIARRAASREPLLAEAHGNLAAALLCQGRMAEAAGEYSRLARRNPAVTDVRAAVDPIPATPIVPAGAPSTGAVADVDTVLDLSQGTPGEIKRLELPINPDAGVASAALFEAASQSRDDAANRALDRSNELSGTLSATIFQDRLRAARTYTTIGFYTDWMRQRPELAGLWDRLRAEHAEMMGVFERFWVTRVPQIIDECNDAPTPQASDRCRRERCVPELSTAHTEWLGHARAGEAAARAWIRDLHQYATAVAANLADPVAHEIVLQLAASQIQGAYNAFLLEPVEVWTEVERDNVRDCAGPGGVSIAEEGEDALPGGFPCPPALKGVKVKFDIDFVAFDINCESITAEVAYTRGLDQFLSGGAFAQVGYNFTNGRTTVFAGGKGALKVGSAVLAGKAGLYGVYDSSGNVVDAGVRLTGAGALSGQHVSAGQGRKIEFSLAGSHL